MRNISHAAGCALYRIIDVHLLQVRRLMTSAEDEQKFAFQPLQNKFLVLEKPDVRDLFTKW